MVKAVLAATVAELARSGYAGFRTDEVAAQARVNKTTVYRRWPTKEVLVAAALRATSGQDEPLPDTGALRSDLVQLLRRTLAFMRRAEGRALTRMFTLEVADPEVERLTRKLRDEIMARRTEVLVRAQARGEIPDDIDTRLVLEAIFAPVMARVMKMHEHVDEATIERLVDLVVRGLEHGGGRLRR